MQNWRRLQQFGFLCSLTIYIFFFGYLPNIFLAHKSVDYDYLANFLVMNCLDDPDDTFRTDAVDFARPKLLAEHFLNRLELHWTVRLIIQHKPLLNLPNVLVDHPVPNEKKYKVKMLYMRNFHSNELKIFAVFLTTNTNGRKENNSMHTWCTMWFKYWLKFLVSPSICITLPFFLAIH